MDGTYNRRGISLVALGLLVLIMIGCGVGLAVGRTGDVLAYACDGEPGARAVDVSEWFGGEVADDGSLELQNENGATLSATVSEDGAVGTLTLPDGTEHGFTAETTKGEAGLYRAEGETRDGGEYVGGWIVLAEGEQQRGALGIRDGTSNTISGSTLNAESLRAADLGVSPIDFPTSR